MRLDELPQSLVPVQVRVALMVLQVLEGILLELEYLSDHLPEGRAEGIALLCQEAREAVPAAPLTPAATGELCAHRKRHV